MLNFVKWEEAQGSKEFCMDVPEAAISLGKRLGMKDGNDKVLQGS